MALRYSSDKVEIVRQARARGLTDAEILTSLCRGEIASIRRSIVRDWAAALGLTAAEALDVARRAGIIR